MTKEEASKRIRRWIADGILMQRSSVIKGGYWYTVWKRVGEGELFFTGIDRIVASDRAVRDEFQKLIESGRVMSITDVTIRHPECRTVNDVEKMVKSGRLAKVNDLPAVCLYVE